MTATSHINESADAKKRLVCFFFEPAFIHGGRTGPGVAVLVGPRWTPYLRTRMGLKHEPFFVRPALPHEPTTFPNGHPFAWVYRKPTEASADEARWLNPSDLVTFESALDAAQAEARHLEQLLLPGVAECVP